MYHHIDPNHYNATTRIHQASTETDVEADLSSLLILDVHSKKDLEHNSDDTLYDDETEAALELEDSAKEQNGDLGRAEGSG